MKTLKQWEKSDKGLDSFIQPGDWVDEGLYNYIGEIVPPCYCSSEFVQGGNPFKEEDGIFFYMTVHRIGNKYLYLGILPEFMQ